MERIVCLLIGYAFGSFLTADVIARVSHHTSIFVLGDGNPGMANVGRKLGRKAALICLAGDVLKTVLAILIARLAFPQLEDLAIPWAGLGATLGHVFPFWHRFKGGKGVATIAATIAATIILSDPLWGCLAAVVGVAAIVISGYLSVAAVVAMAFYAIAMMCVGHPELASIADVFLVLTVYCHWSKLRGIKEGSTHRAGLSVRFRRLFNR